MIKKLLGKVPIWFWCIWLVGMTMIVINLFRPDSSISTLAVLICVAIAIRNRKDQVYSSMVFLLLAGISLVVFIKTLL